MKTKPLAHFGLSMKMKNFYAYNAISEMKVLKVTLFGHWFQASIKQMEKSFDMKHLLKNQTMIPAKAKTGIGKTTSDQVWEDQTILFWRVDVSGDALKNFSLSNEAHLEPLSGSDRTPQHILQRLATSFDFIFTSKDQEMISLFELHSASDEELVYT